MEIPSSTYYYKPKGGLDKKKRDADIADAIEAIACDFPSYTVTGGLQQPSEERK